MPGRTLIHCSPYLKMARRLAIILAVVITGQVDACITETEPNDTPLTATAMSGLGCFTGELSPGDQDLFVWTVDAQDLAVPALAFDLEGVPGHITTLRLLRLTLDDAGAAAEQQEITSLTSRDGSLVTQELTSLPPGTYYLGVSTTGNEGSYTVTIRDFKPLTVIGKAEPLSDSLGAAGTFAASGSSVYSFRTTAPGLYRVQALGEGVRALAYRDAGGEKLKEARDAPLLRLDELALPAGEHYLELTGTEDYVLKVIALGPVSAGTALLEAERADAHSMAAPLAVEPAAPEGWAGQDGCIREVEPNDSAAEATAVATLGCLAGRLENGDRDYYSLPTDAAMAEQQFTLRLTASAPTNVSLSLLDAEGNRLQIRSGGQHIELPDLVLTADAYAVGVTGTAGTAYAGDPVDYRLEVMAQGPARAGFEREPNDRFQNATPFSGSIQGRLAGTDEDVFLLEARGEPQMWDIVAQGAGISQMALLDGSGRQRLVRGGRDEAGRMRFSSVILPPGNNYVKLLGTDTDYTLRAVPLGPPDAAGDRPAGRNEREPNDSEAQADPLRFGETRVGLLADTGDLDYYHFTLHAAETVRLEVVPGSGGGVGARIGSIGDRYYQAEPDEVTIIDAELPPGEHYVQLHATKPSENHYQVRLSRPEPATAAELGVSLALEAATVAAYWHEGQQLTGEAVLTNHGSATAQLIVEASSSHHAWTPALEASQLTLEAGATLRIPLSIDVLPDARDDQPVQVVVSAQSTPGPASAAAVELSAVCEAPPVAARPLWPLPASLLGGLDVAWSGLGARITGEFDYSQQQLIDGHAGGGWLARAGDSVTIELAGDGAVSVAGFLLNPAGTGTAGERLRGFAIAVSLDGSNFENVMEGVLTGLDMEQSFILPQPVQAQYVRLTYLSSQQEDAARIGLGEFKVVAVPDSRPFGDRELNVAAPGAGGYLVWSQPAFSYPTDLTGRSSESQLLYQTRGGAASAWVIGFHHNRAAQITALEWQLDSAGKAAASSSSFEPPASFEVAVSLESPLGPWEPLGTWQTQDSRFALPEPVWARFVRLTSEPLEDGRTYRVPGVLQILERPADRIYRSVAGEWGHDQPAAIYELTESGTDVELLLPAGGNHSQRDALPLAPGRQLQGAVSLGGPADWYVFTVPPGSNTLEVKLAGEPYLSVAYELLSADGRPVPFESTSSAEQVVLLATVEPGDYFIRIEEPPRSIVFAWDDSGSMGTYLEIAYQAVMNFLDELEAGREMVQLLPFMDDPDGRFLLPDWAGDPYEVMAALNDYDRSYSSSSAETTLLAAARALRQRTGTRAVVLITDAESSSYGMTEELWTELAEVRPRVFTLETNSMGSSYPQDLMQSWAGAAGGHYSFTATTGDLASGFARASCHLRRPVQYLIQAETNFQAPAGPGTISVVAAPRAEDDVLPVQVILDASSSMNRELLGERRIEIAKRVLLDLTENVIPAGTPFALRAFGHSEVNSCRTDLEIPLSPLDPAAVRAVVAGIKPKIVSGTPIADSLLAVMTDLQGVDAPKTVILLTDGEESCGGDVEDAIAQLQAQGSAIRLNIITFSDTPKDAMEQFRRWVELGSGHLLTAGEDGLAAMLEPGPALPFEVFAADGELIASGIVGGEAVSVPAGVYTVRVAGKEFEAVTVPGDQEVVLTAAGT